MNIGKYTFEEYVEHVISFHGAAAPGLLIGGFIVDNALKNLVDIEFFEAICETYTCLPDSIQLLTPCTIGNNRLRIFDFGKFAVSLYEKNNGNGIRVYLDHKKIKKWTEINSWFLKLKSKKEQDHELLLNQIKEAGHSILGIQRICVVPEKIKRKKMGSPAVCPDCGESYPEKHGRKCKSCIGESPYIKCSDV
jgi:formylmethanofuran dehydrogenase subunit E